MHHANVDCFRQFELRPIKHANFGNFNSMTIIVSTIDNLCENGFSLFIKCNFCRTNRIFLPIYLCGLFFFLPVSIGILVMQCMFIITTIKIISSQLHCINETHHKCPKLKMNSFQKGCAMRNACVTQWREVHGLFLPICANKWIDSQLENANTRKYVLHFK